MDKLLKMISNLGVFGIIRILFYPIIVVITTPIQLFRSLFRTRILLKGNWRRYPHFNLTAALNSYFYHARAWNIQKYSRNGKTPYLALGDFSLARCFNYTLPSLYGYWKMGAMLLVAGMFTWFGFWFLWFKNMPEFFVIVGLTLFSTTFYANLFRYQNYNVLGWAFFPLGVFAIYHDMFMLSVIAWLLVGLGSFTAVVLSGMVTVCFGLWTGNYLYVLSAFPAALLLAFNFLPFLKMPKSEALAILQKVLKAIGSGKKPKYRRVKAKKFNVVRLYYCLIYFQYILVYWLTSSHVPVLVILGLVIFIVNFMKFRFADDQSIYMFMMTLIVSATLQSDMNWLLIVSMSVAISPIPILMGFDHMKNVIDIVPVAEPIDMKRLYNGVDTFFKNVPKDSKVLFAYKDPGTVYENVYWGRRHFMELPIYVATMNGVKCFPDWWAVFELNFEGAPNVWGVDYHEVKDNMKNWECDYLILDTKEEDIDQKYFDNGFQIVGNFDWNDYQEYFEKYSKLNPKGLNWILLKK